MQEPRKRRRIPYFFVGLSVLAALVVGSGIGIAIAGTENLPQSWHIGDSQVALPTQILDRNGKLISQFAANLEALITQDTTAGTAPADAAAPGSTGTGQAAPAQDATAAGQGARESGGTGTPVSTASARLPRQEESLNLVKLVGMPILKRVLPIAAVAAVAAFVTRRLRKSSK